MNIVGLVSAAALAAFVVAVVTDYNLRSGALAPIIKTTEDQMNAYAKKRAKEQAEKDRWK